MTVRTSGRAAAGMIWRAALAGLIMTLGHGAGHAADTKPAAGGSGLPVPRFVSLKSDRVNLRNGPGTDYPTSWVFRRAGLPVEVVAEFEGWRQVRDAEGTTGWVLQSLLSGRRTALVAPWDAKTDGQRPQLALKTSGNEGSGTVVMIEAGLIANIGECDGRWCHISIDSYRGYIEQKRLWGVYDGEILK